MNPYRRKAMLGSVLLVGLSVLLGGTLFHEELAQAAQIMGVEITKPLDAGGNVKVHEQGTANVNLTNAPLSVHEQGSVSVSEPELEHPFFFGFGADGSEEYTVPAGRALMLEYVNCVSGPDGPDFGACILQVRAPAGPSGEGNHFFPLGPTGSLAKTAFSGLVHIYVPSGWTIANARSDIASMKVYGFTFDEPGR
jgi:hypothetical protein